MESNDYYEAQYGDKMDGEENLDQNNFYFTQE